MESINVTHFENDAVLDKKLDKYGIKDEDFIASQELTVTITLHEYRELVEKAATAASDISLARDKASEAERSAKEASERAARLKAENYDLQKKVSTLQDNLAEAAKQLGEKSEKEDAADVRETPF